jgi:hypothetical protein
MRLGLTSDVCQGRDVVVSVLGSISVWLRVATGVSDVFGESEFYDYSLHFSGCFPSCGPPCKLLVTFKTLLRGSHAMEALMG